MTNEEAIEKLKTTKGYYEPIQMAIKALAKQIPKKPSMYCNNPICQSCYKFCKKLDYCNRCGQALDWSEDE